LTAEVVLFIACWWTSADKSKSQT